MTANVVSLSTSSAAFWRSFRSRALLLPRLAIVSLALVCAWTEESLGDVSPEFPGLPAVPAASLRARAPGSLGGPQAPRRRLTRKERTQRAMKHLESVLKESDSDLRTGTRRRSAVSARRTQNAGADTEEEVTLYDFSFRGEDTLQMPETIVASNLSIRAKLLQNQMMPVIELNKATIVKVCSCTEEEKEDEDNELRCGEDMTPRIYSTMTQDITTFGQKWIRFSVDFRIMTPTGGEAACADALAIAGYGGEKPPWIEMPEPIYRKLVQAEFLADKEFFATKVTEWSISMFLPWCEFDELVVRRAEKPTLHPEDFDADKVCGEYSEDDGGAGAFLAQGNKVPWVSPGELCEFASTACMCAYMKGCGWVNETSGGLRCRKFAHLATKSKVDCEYCPTQEHCPTDPELGCKASLTPCTCLMNRDGCYWKHEEGQCRLRNDPKLEKTRCEDCPRQWICKIARVEKYFPLSGMTLPTMEGGFIVNLTFSRQLRFNLRGNDQILNAGAVNLVCRSPPPSLPKTHNIPLSRMKWINESVDPNNTNDTGMGPGYILQVDINGTLNPYPTDCDMVIAEGEFLDERDLPYTGMPLGEYTLGLGDTVGPTLKSADPRNSAGSVPIDVKVKFNFDEKLRPGEIRQAVVYKFGGATLEAFLRNRSAVLTLGPADKIVAIVEVPVEAVEKDGKTLIVDLEGVLEYEGLYSVALKEGIVTDISKNLFTGLDPGLYVFGTGSPTYEEKELAPEKPEPEGLMAFSSGTLIAMGVGVIIVWLLCVGATYMCYRVVRKRSRVSAELAEEKKGPRTRAAKGRASWDGSFFKAYKLSEEGRLGPDPLSSPAGATTPKGMLHLTSPSSAASLSRSNSLVGTPQNAPPTPNARAPPTPNRRSLGTMESIQSLESVDVAPIKSNSFKLKSPKPQTPGAKNLTKAPTREWRLKEEEQFLPGSAASVSSPSKNAKNGKGSFVVKS